MKTKLIIFLALLSLMSLATFAQDEPDISGIRSSVLRTNKLLSIMKKTTKSVEGVSIEGTEATYYTSTAGVKKIHADMYGETFNAKVDYYYSDSGKLEFIYNQFNRYDTHIMAKPEPKIVRVEERRLYFKNGKLIKRILTVTETGTAVKTEEEESEILSLEKLFREAVKD